MCKKLCLKCSKLKSLDDFSYKNKSMGTRNNECKNCHNTYNRVIYQKNRRYNIDRVKTRKTELKTRYFEYKKTLHCSKCNENDYRCLDFHHPESSEKIDAVSSLLQLCYSWENIMNEIKKCIVLCSNCHRKETFKDK